MKSCNDVSALSGYAYIYIYIYISQKVLQYFDNLSYNSAAPDTFAKVVKVTNRTGL